MPTNLASSFITVDYNDNRFSISQAQYLPGQPSHIVPTNFEESGFREPMPEYPLIEQTTSRKSKSIGKGSIAGITASISVLIILAAACCLWWPKRKESSKPQDDTKGKVELENTTRVYGMKESPRLPRGAELEASSLDGRPLTEYRGRAELPSLDPFKPELESPDDTSRHLEALASELDSRHIENLERLQIQPASSPLGLSALNSPVYYCP